MNWSAPQRPVDYAEQALITAILDKQFLPNTPLPAERVLAGQLGVTRPTLREVLRRLERDGWIIVQQGKPTRVTDFWVNGGLNILSGMVRYSRDLPVGFVTHLLQVRIDLAPSYTRLAVENQPQKVIDLLEKADGLDGNASAFAGFDWDLHHGLTIASGNPVYTLILNSFGNVYRHLAQLYFAFEEARQHSQAFYTDLLQAIQQGNPEQVEKITFTVMSASLELWHRASETSGENKES